MEEERIQKFLDLILNEHYCEDCNELCSTGEAFPLEFVAKYIIKLEEENKRLKAFEDFKLKNDFIPISVIQNKLREIDEKIKNYKSLQELHELQAQKFILELILEKGNK